MERSSNRYREDRVSKNKWKTQKISRKILKKSCRFVYKIYNKGRKCLTHLEGGGLGVDSHPVNPRVTSKPHKMIM